jgi:signal transduction histidine kinase
MTAFAQQPQAADGAEFRSNVPPPVKRPPRWSVSNWPVRWKVFAIVLVPLLLAGTFGGLRVYSGWTSAADLRLAADRAEMVPAIEDYMATLDAALLANSTGGDAQTALSAFDASKQTLQSRLRDTAVVPDVGKGVTSLLQGGQALLDKVTANSIGLRDKVTSYAPILLTAEDAINGSVRVDDETIRAETLGLSRAIGARGQMMMQQLLVNLGGEIPEPELRTSMITLAGTEPSTLFGMSQVLGVGSPDAQNLQAEMVKRMAMMSDPAVVLVNNPELTQSLQATNEIAAKVIRSAVTAVTMGVEDQATAKRNEAIRDSVIVGVAILVALLIVTLVARTLVRPLRKLRDGALQVAHRDLAQELERVRAGGPADPVQPLPVHTTEEVGQVAHAVDELHEQAVLLAGEQARLQLQVGDMFETLSRRSRSLVDQQLTLIDRLESDEEDPERLESLFRLDHLAARMRRNGANLLVLAGSRVPREQAAPVPVAAVINAAASEVEDYTRVVTAVAPDSEILGVLAGDLVHLLAELMDNALRYSPPISQVRVSAVHTGNGGLVIEVSDIGLGMTEPDLRVANTRLQSGGEVNPYTARHMGLFVVGRLAAQHGLVVRLRSTIAGEANSGTTAGVFVPAELLIRGSAPLPVEQPDYGAVSDVHTDSHAAITFQQTVDDEYDEEPSYQDYEPPAAEYRNGHADIPISLLPQRNPGASGISGIPSVPLEPVSEPEPVSLWADEEEWPEDSMPAQTAPAPPPPPAPVERPSQAPTNTSAFFAARAQATNPPTNGVYPLAAASPPPPPRPVEPVQAEPIPAAPSQTSGSEDSIFQKMLSEWLIDDPHQLAQSTDLDWKTVWDNGWEAAAAAEESPVSQHTDHGLPIREPGARLVPGAAEVQDDGHNGRHHNGANGAAVPEDPGHDTGAHTRQERDPEAVRASIGNHFGGVHAGRTHARETRGTDDE